MWVLIKSFVDLFTVRHELLNYLLSRVSHCFLKLIEAFPYHLHLFFMILVYSFQLQNLRIKPVLKPLPLLKQSLNRRLLTQHLIIPGDHFRILSKLFTELGTLFRKFFNLIKQIHPYLFHFHLRWHDFELLINPIDLKLISFFLT